MKLCSSSFDAFCTVYQDTAVSDGAGGLTNAWAQKATLYVHVTQSLASENLDQDGLKTQRRVTFFTHYRSDLNAKDRITLDGVNHNIESITRVNDKGASDYRGKFIRIDTDSSDWFGV